MQYDRDLSYLLAVYVLIQYDDEYLTLLEPDELSKYISDRDSAVESYVGRTCLEPGLEICCYWDPDYPRCNATVYALDTRRPIMVKMFKEMTSSKFTKVNETVHYCKERLSINVVEINHNNSFLHVFRSSLAKL